MDVDEAGTFKVIVNGKQAGGLGKWQEISLIIYSRWDAGGDAEKFAVLTAIRKTYDPKNNTDIRGSQGQTPAQTGRSEGFKELRYQRADPLSSPQIVIVPPVMQYLRLVPHVNNQAEINCVAQSEH